MHNLKTCIACGKQFWANSDHVKCPECAEKSKHASKIKTRTCRTCGKSFEGGPKAWYCPECRAQRQKKQRAEYLSRKRSGSVRAVGSDAVCERCGKLYTVTGGLQRYCPDCAPTVYKEVKNEISKRWNKESGYYEKRQRAREKSRTAVPCVVCGTLFVPVNSAVTCSPECSKKLDKERFAQWEKAHRDERNAYHREKYKQKKQNESRG